MRSTRPTKKKPRETLAPTGLSGPLVSHHPDHAPNARDFPPPQSPPGAMAPATGNEAGRIRISAGLDGRASSEPTSRSFFFLLVSVVIYLFIFIFFCRTMLLARWGFDDPTITRSAMERANTAPRWGTPDRPRPFSEWAARMRLDGPRPATLHVGGG